MSIKFTQYDSLVVFLKTKSIYSNYDEQEFGMHKLRMEAKLRNYKLKKLDPSMESLSLSCIPGTFFKVITTTSQTPIPHG